MRRFDESRPTTAWFEYIYDTLSNYGLVDNDFLPDKYTQNSYGIRGVVEQGIYRLEATHELSEQNMRIFSGQCIKRGLV